MSRKLAVLVALCILLGTCIASIGNQPGLYSEEAVRETRRVFPGLIWADNITQDITWTIDDSFVYIRSSIWVLPGATLTIDPGVVIRFDPGTALNIEGGLVVKGTTFQKVYFIPISDDPVPLFWKGISLLNASRECVFNNATIRFSEHGIANWGSEASVYNSTIEYVYYFGVLAGQNSTMQIRNNYVNFTTWAGIITENRSNAMIRNNHIRTSNHGIVCYGRAEITGNRIQLCWLGILAWGDANVTLNEIWDCMDGIHGFHASPRVEGNRIISCDGNGTRFINSNALIKDNILSYNNVGMDIDYESRHLLQTMENNLVNGIDITDCFFVDQKNLVIDGLVIDSGRSKGYTGSLTAQGSVTLYDCPDTVIRNSRITNTVNSIFATNSSFTVLNTDLGDPALSHVYLDANATGLGFNRSVDPDRVIVGGENCLFQTFDELTVNVRDFHGEPILGARVMVKEGQLILHDVTTDMAGDTPLMLAKDRTTSESGVIFSPLTVEVMAPGYTFGQNPRTGVLVNTTRSLQFADLGDIVPPTIMGISVTDGDRSFPLDGAITVMFSETMNRTSAEGAFSISGNVTGTFSWDGWNMTFIPNFLEHGTHYTVVVSDSAADERGNTLASTMSFSFTTNQAPSGGGGSPMLLIVMIAIFAACGVAGWLILRKLR